MSMGCREQLEAVLAVNKDRIEQSIRQGEEQLKNGPEPRSLAELMSDTDNPPQEDT